VDLAYFFDGGGNWNGASEDSARYSYDLVRWTGSVDDEGNVSTDGAVNGYDEDGQLNARAIYSDLVFSDGSLFVGNEGDDYSNLFDGVGDWGANGNDTWNCRFNLNIGYYF